MIRFIGCVALLLGGPLLAAAPVKKPLPKTAAKPVPTASKPTPVPARIYDFKGIPLGISLEDFRTKPHPDGKPSKVVCTGDELPDELGGQEAARMTRIYDDTEKSLGVKRCVFMEQSGISKYYYEAALNLAATRYNMTPYGFYFIADPKDGVMRLFRFSGTSVRDAAAEVITAMTGKFGQPHIVTDKVQNKMGASFDHVIATWSNPLSAIIVEDRYSKIDDMGIVMIDTRLSKIINDADAAKKAATPNAI